MKQLLTPLACACLLAGAASAHAGAYSGMVVFGDSLSDAGQRPEAAAPSNPVRHTNRVGPTYAAGEAYGSTSPMLINDGLGLTPQVASTNIMRALNGQADGNNWAVGGYRTEQVYDSITGVFDPATGRGGSQVRAGLNYSDPLIRQRDGYLVYLRNMGLSVDPNTLFYVNGGGNDFLQGLVVDDASARLAAGRLAAGVEALQAAGGRYFMVPLLVDVPSPAYGGLLNPAQEALAASFNAELATRLAAVNAEVIPLNVPLLYREVLADPAAFGFDPTENLLGTCFSGCASINPQYGITGLTPDPDRLIYADVVHPSTAMQRILADQGLSILAAPWEISRLPQAGESALRSSREQLRRQLLSDWGAWQGEGQWRGFVGGALQRSDYDGDDTAAAGDGRSEGLGVGASYRLNEQWRLGLTLDVQKLDMEMGASDSDYGLHSYLAGAFAQYQDGLLWGDLGLNAGYLDYHDLKRRFALGRTTRSERGDTEGQVLGLGGRFGIELSPLERLRLSPFVSADIARIEVDGYSESGASSTALSYGEQTLDSRRLGLGLQARFALADDAELYVEIVREREFEDDESEVDMSLNSVPGVDFSLVGAALDRDQTRASLGLRQRLAADLSLQLGYDYRKAGDDDLHGVGLSLSLDW
ncbi:autotransporter domain-containing protein [Pseudomonas sp. Gutcm_11s]|uniref:autotransporter domain-containing protein n=1 Tax=Pseudomonas sp. Gutcm_11s TaxID=3026088 RepID=UPI00235F1409|nr:autotransporter domain-containing SGNH/GDSL hydrolase family protein [Pseudomonas sp. Gutcm_11s]MDD0845234.1 autotransporter domain-containing protein [Pseudomonas sp. Gutcm_11s]